MIEGRGPGDLGMRFKQDDPPSGDANIRPEDGETAGQQPEEGEKEKARPVFVVYRDNDLFSKWATTVTEEIHSLGRQVSVQIFPKGTEKNQIDDWIEEHKTEIEDSDLIADGTVIKSLDSKGMREVLKSYLDSIMSSATYQAVCGLSENELNDSFSDLGDEFRKEGGEEAAVEKRRELESKVVGSIVSSIPENEKPQRIIVRTAHLGDHWFRKNGKSVILEEEELEERAKVIAQYFIDAGIPDTIVNGLGSQEAAVKRTYRVIDRHAAQSSESDLLRWPLESFYQDCCQNFHLEFDQDQFREALQNNIKRIFENKQ